MEKKGGEFMRISVDLAKNVLDKIDKDAVQHMRTRKAEIELILLGWSNNCTVSKTK